jgi:hypothetical protein
MRYARISALLLFLALWFVTEPATALFLFHGAGAAPQPRHVGQPIMRHAAQPRRR